MRIAGHVIPAPDGFRLEGPPTDFVCFTPRRDIAPLAVSFCARPLTNRGVLTANTFPVDSYRFGDGEVQIRGLANDRTQNADTVYFVFEGEDLFLFAECLGSGRGQELIDRCSPQRLAFNDWLRAVL